MIYFILMGDGWVPLTKGEVTTQYFNLSTTLLH